MLRFYLKKYFFTLWDNLLHIILMNTLFLFTVGFLTFGFMYVRSSSFALLYQIIGITILSFIINAFYAYTLDLIEIKESTIKTFIMHLLKNWKESLFLLLNILIIIGIFSIAVPFYFFQDSYTSIILGIIVFWVGISLTLVSIFFLALKYQLKEKLLKNLNLAFKFLLENSLFSFCTLLFAIILLPISIFLLLLIPGPAGIIFWFNMCAKIRLLKYDYQKEHPNEKKIPWKILVEAENEELKSRTFRGIIFPWKK